MADLSEFQHPRFARMYERISAESEQRGTAERRDLALAGLSGRVIEVGAGNGMNFTHYPDTVTEVVAVEPEDRLRALAEQAAEKASVPVRVVAGHAGALPAEDRSFDAAVASLVLCSVTDVPAALAEIRRVLRPGGELRFFEHVRSANPLLGLLQDALTPVWSRAGGGCHLNRDTAESIRAAGFQIEPLHRFSYAPLRFVPPHAHILGRARIPT
ncbi:class I SAM-dependent methyltransferase [Amycolatopsis saalfeldensis]|uniref:Methyltransferase domain-containing protein n=1 Tax=Amycolatopsis saalfeldensis TaxID=394193 RepID=A0A1H8YMC9_9PSEU|nr:class I SAM-dependent methyltransferase [Amycolatopsis saalfeldensis]SEP53337.1 Methyltransferase domain-containing protein [Amycolatopsis saalfeldensis]